MVYRPNQPVHKCERCGSEWFERVRTDKFPIEEFSILGQAPTPDAGIVPFWLLRCIMCGKFREPNVLRGVRDPINEPYDRFLDEIEKGFK